MKVYMTIGYADAEATKVDGVFTTKEAAIDHALDFIANSNNWRDIISRIGGKDEFVTKTKEYIMSHNDDDQYWYLWDGSDFWKEIFPDWIGESNDLWVGIHEVELNNGKED